jgi:hypothetical protein
MSLDKASRLLLASSLINFLSHLRIYKISPENLLNSSIFCKITNQKELFSIIILIYILFILYEINYFRIILQYQIFYLTKYFSNHEQLLCSEYTSLKRSKSNRAIYIWPKSRDLLIKNVFLSKVEILKNRKKDYRHIVGVNFCTIQVLFNVLKKIFHVDYLNLGI